MMKCEITDRDQRIDDFLLAKLSPEDADAFEIHLFGCPECLAELRLREQMVKLIKEERVTAVADHAKRQPTNLVNSVLDFLRLQQNIWIYAGAAAVLLIGFFIISLLRRQETPNMYAANFVEAPDLESKVGQALRSGEFSLSVITPKIGENFTNDIAFRWEIKKDGELFSVPLDLKVMNNRGDSVFQVKIETNEYILKQRMSPGLYYWALVEEDGQQLYLGKLFFKKPKP